MLLVATCHHTSTYCVCVKTYLYLATHCNVPVPIIPLCLGATTWERYHRLLSAAVHGDSLLCVLLYGGHEGPISGSQGTCPQSIYHTNKISIKIGLNSPGSVSFPRIRIRKPGTDPDPLSDFSFCTTIILIRKLNK